MAEQQNPALRIEQVSLDHLRTIAESGQLYAVADATDAPAVPKKVLELGPQRAISLYRGTAEEEFWEVAPYLMHVDPPLLNWIVSTLDKTRWGIFAVSKANLDTLRTHFRHFLKVRAPGEEIWHFRFYDPRVLALFLPACTAQEIRTFLGPAFRFGICDDGASSVSFLNELSQSRSLAGQVLVANSSAFFQLRPAHVEAVRPLAEADFVRRVAEHLQKEHFAAVEHLSDDILKKRIECGIERARRFRINAESSLATFVALMFEFSPNFDENPRVRKILNDTKLHPDDRVHYLTDEITDEDWQTVKRNRDEKAWTVPGRGEL